LSEAQTDGAYVFQWLQTAAVCACRAL